MLIGLFERCMKRRGVKESDPYDWEKTPTAPLNVPISTQLPTLTGTQMAQGSGSAQAIPPPCTLADQTATRVDNMAVDNNQENIEPDNRRELEVIFLFLFRN